jgi:hypothetical protein
LALMGKSGCALQILQTWGRGNDLAPASIQPQTDASGPRTNAQKHSNTGHFQTITVLKAWMRLRLATKKHHSSYA